MLKYKFEPRPLQRLEEFLFFCNGLEQHPFYGRLEKKEHKISMNIVADATGERFHFGFDEIYLESYLTRLRQFCFKGELFYFDALLEAVSSLLEEDTDFKKFQNTLSTFFSVPLPKTPQMQVFNRNGEDLIEGYLITDIIEARLYTGAIHSERRIKQLPGSLEEEIMNMHLFASKYLTFVAAEISMPITKNIFATRNQILRRAKAMEKVNILPELLAYSQRVANKELSK